LCLFLLQDLPFSTTNLSLKIQGFGKGLGEGFSPAQINFLRFYSVNKVYNGTLAFGKLADPAFPFARQREFISKTDLGVDI